MQFKVGNCKDSNIRMLTGTIKADWMQQEGSEDFHDKGDFTFSEATFEGILHEGLKKHSCSRKRNSHERLWS